jgi:hypothetical protein
MRYHLFAVVFPEQIKSDESREDGGLHNLLFIRRTMLFAEIFGHESLALFEDEVVYEGDAGLGFEEAAE